MGKRNKRKEDQLPSDLLPSTHPNGPRKIVTGNSPSDLRSKLGLATQPVTAHTRARKEALERMATALDIPDAILAEVAGTNQPDAFTGAHRRELNERLFAVEELHRPPTMSDDEPIPYQVVHGWTKPAPANGLPFFDANQPFEIDLQMNTIAPELLDILTGKTPAILLTETATGEPSDDGLVHVGDVMPKPIPDYKSETVTVNFDEIHVEYLQCGSHTPLLKLTATRRELRQLALQILAHGIDLEETP